MNYLCIKLLPDMPSLTLLEILFSDSMSAECIGLQLTISGFYDWIVRDGQLVGIHLLPLSKSDISSFRQLRLPYVILNDDDIIIWFTPIHSGETLCVQDFNAILDVSDECAPVLRASLWSIDSHIIANTLKANQSS